MSKEHALYNIKRGPHGYAIGKFDRDLNLLAAYNTSTDYCSCPAGPRPTCRHRKMLPRVLSKVDQPEFYCYETQTWHRPLEAFGLEPSERGAEAALAAAGGNKVVQEPLLASRQLNGDGREDRSPEPPIGLELIEADEQRRLYDALPPASPSAPAPTIRRR